MESLRLKKAALVRVPALFSLLPKRPKNPMVFPGAQLKKVLDKKTVVIYIFKFSFFRPQEEGSVIFYFSRIFRLFAGVAQR